MGAAARRRFECEALSRAKLVPSGDGFAWQWAAGDDQSGVLVGRISYRRTGSRPKRVPSGRSAQQVHLAGPADGLGAVGRLELAVDVARVALDGAHGDVEIPGDLCVGPAGRQEGQDLQLSLAQWLAEGPGRAARHRVRGSGEAYRRYLGWDPFAQSVGYETVARSRSQAAFANKILEHPRGFVDCERGAHRSRGRGEFSPVHERVDQLTFLIVCGQDS